MLGFDCRLDVLHLFHEIPTCYVDNTTRIRGVSIVVPTCKPPTLKALGTFFCGKLQPAQNRFSFCGPPESNRGPAGGTLRRKTVRIYYRTEHAALVAACPTNSCEVVLVTGTLIKRLLHT